MSDGRAPLDPTAFAERMMDLLVKLEAELFADARPCPFCSAHDAPIRSARLVHAADCELDATLRDAGVRRFHSTTER